MIVSRNWISALLGEDTLDASKLEVAWKRAGWSVSCLTEDDALGYVVPSSSQDQIWTLAAPSGWPLPQGHITIARLTAALHGLNFQPPGIDAPASVCSSDIEKSVTVVSEEMPQQAWFGGVGLELPSGPKPSPTWLQERLGALGIASVDGLQDAAVLSGLEHGVEVYLADLDTLTEGLLRLEPAPARHMAETPTSRALGARLVLAGRLVDRNDRIVFDALEVVSSRHAVSSRTRRALLFVVHAPAPDARSVDPASVRSRALDVLMQAGATSTWISGASAMRGMLFETQEPWQPRQLLLDAANLGTAFDAGVGLERLRRVFDALGFHSQTVGTSDKPELLLDVPYSGLSHCDAECLLNQVIPIGQVAADAR